MKNLNISYSHTEIEYHDALAQYFDIAFLIAETPNANINWNDLHNLNIDIIPPSFSSLNDKSFLRTVEKYQRLLILMPEDM